MSLAWPPNTIGEFVVIVIIVAAVLYLLSLVHPLLGWVFFGVTLLTGAYFLMSAVWPPDTLGDFIVIGVILVVVLVAINLLGDASAWIGGSIVLFGPPVALVGGAYYLNHRVNPTLVAVGVVWVVGLLIAALIGSDTPSKPPKGDRSQDDSMHGGMGGLDD